MIRLLAILFAKTLAEPTSLRKLVRVFDILVNPRRHRLVISAVKGPGSAGLLALQPQATIKYLRHDYLALDLTTAQRAAMFAQHYEFISKFRSLTDKLSQGESDVWQHSNGQGTHQIGLDISQTIDNEGELTAAYRLDGQALSVISFTFIDGATLGMGNETVLFITRVQGAKGLFAEIQQATRALHDIAPSFALMAALQGFADALNVRHAVAVSAEQQVCADKHDRDNQHAHDRFMAAHGAIRIAELPPCAEQPQRHLDYFYAPLPFAEKPMSLVKRSHRSRTKIKRRVKRQISQDVRDVVLSGFVAQECDDPAGQAVLAAEAGQVSPMAPKSTVPSPNSQIPERADDWARFPLSAARVRTRCHP